MTNIDEDPFETALKALGDTKEEDPYQRIIGALSLMKFAVGEVKEAVEKQHSLIFKKH